MGIDIKKNVVLFVPTIEEAVSLQESVAKGVEVIISGVGMVRCAAAVAKKSMAGCDKIFLLAGIAGAYPRSGLKPGDCVVVGSERVADQGAFRDGEFKELYNATYHCPLAKEIKSLPLVSSNSVNAAAAGFIDMGADFVGRGGVSIENMEGAGFFALCETLGVEFIQVRAISNMTTDDRAAWQMDRATNSLAEGVKKVLDEIKR